MPVLYRGISCGEWEAIQRLGLKPRKSWCLTEEEAEGFARLEFHSWTGDPLVPFGTIFLFFLESDLRWVSGFYQNKRAYDKKVVARLKVKPLVLEVVRVMEI